MIHEIGPHKYHVEYQNLIPRDEDFYIGFSKENGNALVKDSEEVCLPTIGEAKKLFHLPEDVEYTYLFSIDDEHYFGTIDYSPEETPGYVYKDGHPLLIRKPRYKAFAANLGHEIIGWYERSRYCGRCGSKTVRSKKERMTYCEKCGNMIYPQICPCVIVGVRDGERLLVTKYSDKHHMVNNGRTYAATTHLSLVAGYIEVGETPIQTVRREVREEVGLEVKNIRFFDAAPWPLTGSMLLGYFCDVDGDPTPKIDKSELAEVSWIERKDMEDRSHFQSLTTRLMEAFRLGTDKEEPYEN